VAGVAAQKYGPKIADEQEVLVHIADMVMETYALESAVLRAAKMHAAGSPIAMVQGFITLLVSDAMERAGRAGRAALNHAAEGDELRMMQVGLKRFTKPPSDDLVAAGRAAAKVLIDNGSYRVPS